MLMVLFQPAAVDRSTKQYFFFAERHSLIQNQTTVVLIHLKYTISVCVCVYYCVLRG